MFTETRVDENDTGIILVLRGGGKGFRIPWDEVEDLHYDIEHLLMERADRKKTNELMERG